MKLQNKDGNNLSPDLAAAFNCLELELSHHSDGPVATVFVNSPEYLKSIHGCMIEVDKDSKLAYLKPMGKQKAQPTDATLDSTGEKSLKSAPLNSEHYDMTAQDRYIDSRLTGIESKIDARIEAMQRFQEQAENRFQRASERHETDIALTRQQIHQEFKDAREAVANESASNRRHATTSALGTIAGVVAVIAIVAAIFAVLVSEQGSYAKSYGETQVEIQRAADERAEFREAFQAIQATQQSILERLPPPVTE